MPCIAAQTRLQSAQSTSGIALTVTHTLSVLPTSLIHEEEDCSIVTRLRTTTIPALLDVYLSGSRASLHIIGSHNGKSIPCSRILSSGLVAQLVKYIERNKTTLGIEDSSEPFESDGVIKVVLTPDGPFSTPPHTNEDVPPIHLVNITLRIESKSNQSNSEQHNSSPQSSQETSYSSFSDLVMSTGDENVFDSTLSVAYTADWNSLIEKFLTHHVVKRYPHIFGKWRLKHATELPLFTCIAKSLTKIVLNSDNKALKTQAKRTFKILESQKKRSVDMAWFALSDLRSRSGSNMIINEEYASRYRAALPDEEDDADDMELQERFERTIYQTLSSLWRRTIKAGKGIKLSGMTYADDDETETLDIDMELEMTNAAHMFPDVELLHTLPTALTFMDVNPSWTQEASHLDDALSDIPSLERSLTPSVISSAIVSHMGSEEDLGCGSDKEIDYDHRYHPYTTPPAKQLDPSNFFPSYEEDLSADSELEYLGIDTGSIDSALGCDLDGYSVAYDDALSPSPFEPRTPLSLPTRSISGRQQLSPVGWKDEMVLDDASCDEFDIECADGVDEDMRWAMEGSYM